MELPDVLKQYFVRLCSENHLRRLPRELEEGLQNARTKKERVRVVNEWAVKNTNLALTLLTCHTFAFVAVVQDPHGEGPSSYHLKAEEWPTEQRLLHMAKEFGDNLHLIFIGNRKNQVIQTFLEGFLRGMNHNEDNG